MIHVGDCLLVLPTLEANSVDAIITDPPYHLTTGKKGGTGEASVNLNTPAGRSRIGTGFMGKKWDGGDVAFRPETWAAALRVAKPGAFLVAFGGTRTFHRLACAIEDGGWELRDTVLRMHEGGQTVEVPLEDCPWLLAWAFGSGFPKSHNLDPFSRIATRQTFEEFGTALKPAFEPIILARKPMRDTVLDSVLDRGVGALNIGGCRIETGEDLSGGAYAANGGRTVSPSMSPSGMNRPGATAGEFEAPEGRWPANIVHDGSDAVVGMFPDSDGARGDLDGNEPSAPFRNAYNPMGRRAASILARDDGGSAARFFYCAKADRADRNHGCEGLPAKQAGMVSNTSGQHMTRRDGGAPPPAANHHPTVKPHALMRWLCRLVTPPGGLVLDPFAGSGSTGRAALAEGFRFEGIELDAEYARIAEARIHATQPGLRFGETA